MNYMSNRIKKKYSNSQQTNDENKQMKHWMKTKQKKQKDEHKKRVFN